LLPEAKDYKRIGEQDSGLNTGGMGAVSPVPFADEVFLTKVKERIIVPTIRGLQEAAIAYTGFIFIGLMNVGGEPYVIEYNVRLGDPETEVVLPRIASDLVELLLAAAKGKLAEATLSLSPQYATTVMLVSGGYPEHYEKDKVMQGLDTAAQDSLLFHAGTRLQAGQVLTNGGRVLACTALADSLEEALQKSKKAAAAIHFEKKYFRTDIGNDLLSIVSSSL
jgi:phosphoribosylamine--glycine ligase